MPSHLGVDSLVVGFYRGKDLYYAARVRAGFIPATRLKVFEAIKHLKTQKCPFVNLPEKEAGRWGQGIDGGEDAGMRVVDAGSHSADRVFGMDGSESSATHEVRRPA